MANFSNKKDAVQLIRMTGIADPFIFILEQHVRDAETDLLVSNPNDVNLRDKLVKVHTLRNLTETLRKELK